MHTIARLRACSRPTSQTRSGDLYPLHRGAIYLWEMTPFRKPRGPRDPDGEVAEDPVVRQYRFLLRTAPLDALEAVHLESLGTLDDVDRTAVLSTVQEQLVAGLRLRSGNVPAIARLVTLGERRTPGALLRHCPPEPLQRLAAAALASEAAFGLLTGYAAWDGADPEPPTEAELDKDFGSKWHDARLNPGVAWQNAIGGHNAGGVGGGYGGDGGG
jgi:hypothetical protein